MLPYDQMKAMAEQRMSDLESQAERYREASHDRGLSLVDRIAASIQQKWLEAKDAVSSREFNGPIQPAI